MLAIIWVGVCSGTAQGAFLLVENFDGLILGNVSGQNGWSAVGYSSNVAMDPTDNDNQVLAVTTDSTNAHKDVTLSNGAVRMLFLRFHFVEQLNYSFGMSHTAAPDQFDDFESELSMRNSTDELRINDGGTYTILTTLTPDTWYNVWMVINNDTDDIRVYLNSTPGGDASAGDLLDNQGQTVFEFRNNSAANLLSFFIKTGGGNSKNSGPLYLDDIYLENTSALNLRNPTAIPASEVCEGDLDADGVVDGSDLAIFAADFGLMDCKTGHSACGADFDLDGDVDGSDLTTFAADFGRTDCP
jgi:hypothetical protein